MTSSTQNHAQRPALEGVTLEAILTHLSEHMGWAAMASAIPIRCFSHDPSIKSSLKFLRRTPWARARVEQLYLQQMLLRDAPNKSVTPAEAGVQPIDITGFRRPPE